MLEVRRLATAAVLLLPGGLVLYFAFNSGGFYPGPQAYVAVVLCLILALRVLFAKSPFAGISRPLTIAVVALALYTGWTLLSGSWSHAPGVARIHFDLPLLYLLAMLLFGSIRRSRGQLAWMVRALTVACVVVCTCALITRLLPHVWPTSSSIVNNRLSFPVTYWNVLGLLAALGIAFCLHLSSDPAETRVVRTGAAAAIPLLAATLFFTFSRGAIAACIIAVVVYALLGRPRAMISSLLAVGPATAVALKLAYDANLLATPTPTTPEAVIQGHHLAIGIGLCALGAAILRAALALSLDQRLDRFRLPNDIRHTVARTGWISIAIAALVAIVALSGTIATEYHRFVRPGGVGNPHDFRTRLTDPGNNGRIDLWTVAWRQFKAAPVIGQGAGTFQHAWAKYRPWYELPALNAHSLYLESLDELGVIGFVLLVIAILAILMRVATRARGPNRPLYAAVFAVVLAWALHAGIDWDWQMPVVTIIVFALGGFAIATRKRQTRDADGLDQATSVFVRRPLLRVPIAVALILLAVLPAIAWLAQVKLDDAEFAFSKSNYAAARTEALSSIGTLGNQAEPYEVLSYSDLELGMPKAALASIDKAVSLDPGDWNYRYSLALVRAAVGLDPRTATRLALSMNPHEPLVQDEWQMFRAGTPSQWKAEANSVASSLSTL